jgi:hypothetical protein
VSYVPKRLPQRRHVQVLFGLSLPHEYSPAHLQYCRVGRLEADDADVGTTRSDNGAGCTEAADPDTQPELVPPAACSDSRAREGTCTEWRNEPPAAIPAAIRQAMKYRSLVRVSRSEMP